MPSQQKYRRSIRLIKPTMQWKFIVIFACVAIVAVTFEGMVFNRMLVGISADLPHDEKYLMAQLSPLLFKTLGVTLLMLIPLAVFMGILTTFRIAGPLHRFEQHLGAIAAGEDPGVCRIRDNDELQDLCHLINSATEALRKAHSPTPDAPEAADDSKETPSMRLVS